MQVAAFTDSSFAIAAGGAKARVIELVPGQIVTRAAIETAPLRDGRLVADPDRDLLKIAAIERHHATGRVGIGLVRGFGLRRGAIAGTVAHDAHNLIVAGTNDADMRAAAQALVEAGGGFAVAEGGRAVCVMPLPIAGLMSDRPLSEVVASQAKLLQAARALGGALDNPFMTLSFLALTPIPSLKITDRGLFDASVFQPVALFAD